MTVLISNDARASPRVPEYLAAHAGMVTLIVALGIRYDMEMQALAGNKAGLGLLVDALWELFKVMQVLGYQVTPP